MVTTVYPVAGRMLAGAACQPAAAVEPSAFAALFAALEPPQTAQPAEDRAGSADAVTAVPHDEDAAGDGARVEQDDKLDAAIAEPPLPLAPIIPILAASVPVALARSAITVTNDISAAPSEGAGRPTGPTQGPVGRPEADVSENAGQALIPARATSNLLAAETLAPGPGNPGDTDTPSHAHAAETEGTGAVPPSPTRQLPAGPVSAAMPPLPPAGTEADLPDIVIPGNNPVQIETSAGRQRPSEGGRATDRASGQVEAIAIPPAPSWLGRAATSMPPPAESEAPAPDAPPPPQDDPASPSGLQPVAMPEIRAGVQIALAEEPAPPPLPRGMPPFWAARELSDQAGGLPSAARGIPIPPEIAPAAPLPDLQPGADGGDAAELPSAPALAVSPAGHPAPPAPSLAAPVAPTMPPQLPAQIAAALTARSDRALELRLVSEELGALHLSLRPDGDQIAVILRADRGETLDMLRRHGDQLAEEMRAAGFAGAALSFAGGDGRADRPPRPLAEPLTAAIAPSKPLPAPAPTAPAGSGLDLRL